MSGMTRRTFTAGVAASLASPAVVMAQHLDKNDIWTKQPKRKLHSAGALCMDCSNSMEENELQTQAYGTASAFVTPLIRDLITTHNSVIDTCGVALCLIAFNNEAQVRSGDENDNPWAVLETEADIDQFITHLINYSPTEGIKGTNIIGALRESLSAHNTLPHSTAKKFCDVSTDGHQSTNAGITNLQPYDYAGLLAGNVISLANNGIVVNVLSMGDSHVQLPTVKDDDGNVFMPTTLKAYHKQFLQTPRDIATAVYNGGFTISVSKRSRDFDVVYRNAIARKLQRELA